MSNRYEYLVSYAHQSGFGRASVFRSAPADSLEAVEEMEAAIRQNNPSTGPIAAINIVLLREWSE
jgi:hypothetical protein